MYKRVTYVTQLNNFYGKLTCISTELLYRLAAKNLNVGNVFMCLCVYVFMVRVADQTCLYVVTGVV